MWTRWAFVVLRALAALHPENLSEDEWNAASALPACMRFIGCTALLCLASAAMLLRKARLETTIDPFDRSDVQASRNAPIPP